MNHPHNHVPKAYCETISTDSFPFYSDRHPKQLPTFSSGQGPFRLLLDFTHLSRGPCLHLSFRLQPSKVVRKRTEQRQNRIQQNKINYKNKTKMEQRKRRRQQQIKTKTKKIISGTDGYVTYCDHQSRPKQLRALVNKKKSQDPLFYIFFTRPPSVVDYTQSPPFLGFAEGR